MDPGAAPAPSVPPVPMEALLPGPFGAGAPPDPSFMDAAILGLKGAPGKGDFGKGDVGKGKPDTGMKGKGDFGMAGKDAFGKGDFGKGDFGKGDFGKSDFGKGDFGKGDFDFGKGEGYGPMRGKGKAGRSDPYDMGYGGKKGKGMDFDKGKDHKGKG